MIWLSFLNREFRIGRNTNESLLRLDPERSAVRRHAPAGRSLPNDGLGRSRAGVGRFRLLQSTGRVETERNSTRSLFSLRSTLKW